MSETTNKTIQGTILPPWSVDRSSGRVVLSLHFDNLRDGDVRALLGACDSSRRVLTVLIPEVPDRA